MHVKVCEELCMNNLQTSWASAASEIPLHLLFFHLFGVVGRGAFGDH